MSKKLVLVGPYPPPVHGVSYLLKQFVAYCENKSIKIKVIRTSPNRKKHSFGDLDIRTFLLAVKLVFQIFLVSLFNRKDTIYVNVATKGAALYRDMVLVYMLKVFRVKSVYIHIHGTELSHYSKNRKRLIKKCFGWTKLIFVSQSLRNEHDWLSLDSKSTYVVPNGCDDLLQRDNKNKKSELKLLFFSNFYKGKGVEEFIDVTRHLAERNFRFRAVMCGSYTNDYSQESLRKLIKESNVDNLVEVRGPTYDEEKKSIFNESDILVFPSHKESFGNVMIEAMSSMTLVIASKTTSTEFILDNNRAGFFTDNFDSKEVAQLIVNLDQSELEKKIGNARSRYESLFTLEHFNNEIFKRLCDG